MARGPSHAFASDGQLRSTTAAAPGTNTTRMAVPVDETLVGRSAPCFPRSVKCGKPLSMHLVCDTLRKYRAICSLPAPRLGPLANASSFDPLQTRGVLGAALDTIAPAQAALTRPHATAAARRVTARAGIIPVVYTTCPGSSSWSTSKYSPWTPSRRTTRIRRPVVPPAIPAARDPRDPSCHS
jgi:hypothetical protein